MFKIAVTLAVFCSVLRTIFHLMQQMNRAIMMTHFLSVFWADLYRNNNVSTAKFSTATIKIAAQ